VKVRVIALGSEMARDDGAALLAAERLTGRPGVEVVAVGRPGPGLLDLLDPTLPTLLMDVVRRGAEPGALVELRLHDLTSAAIGGEVLSSHDMGVAEALRLAGALGRSLPDGRFLGIGGRDFAPGDEPSAKVSAGIDDLVAAAERIIAELDPSGVY
jgi:hydrogenase maturation protease